MLRVGPAPLRHAVSCDCAVSWYCVPWACVASVLNANPPTLTLSSPAWQNHNVNQPEARLLMHESCKVTHKQTRLNDRGYADAKNKHTHTTDSKENNWNHSAWHLWCSRVPHCTYVGMSGLCACIGCMRICSLSPLSLGWRDFFYLLWIWELKWQWRMSLKASSRHPGNNQPELHGGNCGFECGTNQAGPRPPWPGILLH